MRASFVAGNWKMHLDRARAVELCAALRGSSAVRAALQSGVAVGVFPPFVYLPLAVEALDGSGLAVGAQTCHPEAQGAFTGEVAARQIADVGATHVLIGHSERRQLFREGDADVRARLAAALAAGLRPILCLGETLAERQAGTTTEVVERQLEAALEGLDAAALASVTVAYEPVWAIGTGHNATPQQAQAVHALLRQRVARRWGAPAAAALVIQYGGSVKPDNAATLLAEPDVDGALVGGASLEARAFESIVAACPRRAASRDLVPRRTS